ncbi:S-layer homology domain-containing protein [Paenibacillus sp. DS2015]|uniref:S-layer homology domain-containing protein n=1 Tax=Paenibacillus sp. DS2015 TaxID=3373917 RepID=UPI003D1D35A8
MPSFIDSDKISVWARSEVGTLTISNLINGYVDGSFRPKTNLTRAEGQASTSIFILS